MKRKAEIIHQSRLFCCSCGKKFMYQTEKEHFLTHFEKECEVHDIDNFKEPIPCPDCNCTKIKYDH